ncbi:NADH:ubiquinone oxidoreductase [Streptomyces sp. DW26H14]|uniref:NADH-quinone oxidoreductase subunit B family protein n=1 Tax=Streptomyces sp. DW26H14 TaxID=3435395 RepID=UPI00403DB7C5
MTTDYPRRPDPTADRFPAAIRVRGSAALPAGQETADLCPTGAITVGDDGTVRLDRGRCILCRRCVRARPDLFAPAYGTEIAELRRPALTVPPREEDSAALAAVRGELAARTARFRRSLHVRHIDAGSDGSEEWEIAALTNPVYDIHRLGIFFTASPRHADLLMITGAGTRGMVPAVRRTYEATARPVAVLAVGSDACSGGIHAGSYATLDGIGRMADVDVWVPGSPPSPFSLLHALLLAVGRISDHRGKP